MDSDGNKFGICLSCQGKVGSKTGCVCVPGKMTYSLFLERSLSNFTSSSGRFDSSCNMSPAAFANFQTISATCSALGIAPSVRSSVKPLEAGSVLSVFAASSRDTRPEERTIAPVSRERIKVACTPAFCDRRLRWAKLSSSEVCCIVLSRRRW